ncbi:MAG: S-adenosylmethionine:tRNA ribosyltransferase-isomerase, partial [Runella sp.]
KGIGQGFVTLHVGAGTFQPIKVKNVIEHTMHGEQMIFNQSFIAQLLSKANDIVAVGTTSMRALESLYWYGASLWLHQNDNETPPFFVQKLQPYQTYSTLPTPQEALQKILEVMHRQGVKQLVGETEIMIFPGYEFKMCKGLITNFHQPGSTLMLLVAAFVGDDWRKIYEAALTNDYRFLSYGDSSLLWGNP